VIIITADLNEWKTVEGESIEDMVLRNSIAVFHDKHDISKETDKTEPKSENTDYSLTH